MARPTEQVDGETVADSPPRQARRTGLRRRRILGYAAGGALGAAGACAGAWWMFRGGKFPTLAAEASEVFKGDAPRGELWEQWQKRGWAKEARHWRKLGKNIRCKLCPNACLLSPGDRGRCRVRVNKDSTLYTLGYANPCSFNVSSADAVEKKPLYHFLPGTTAYSLAVAGCGFRCLNCQNWSISQRRPDEMKDPRGPELLATPELFERARRTPGLLGQDDLPRMTLRPRDVVAFAQSLGAASVAYTYTEPTVWFEYMVDTARLAKDAGLRNVWVTCGYINREPLEELCQVIHAANVDLKSFREDTYAKLNSGKLQPVLDTLVTLKELGVWFEVTNLVVPTYTDDPDMIARMCDWLVEKIGPDYPLHFSRFHPDHKLTHLPPTPRDILVRAKEIARKAGLRYVYVGNIGGIEDASLTRCPACHKGLVVRDGYRVQRVDVQNGKCKHCGQAIAGVWS